MARAVARTRFSRFLGHLSRRLRIVTGAKWRSFITLLYAYEELFAACGDRPRQSRSLLASMERFIDYLTRNDAPATIPLPEDRSLAGLRKFTARAAADYLEDLILIGEECEHIRATMPSGGERTYLMTALMGRAAMLAGREGVAAVAENLFKRNTPGARVIALSLSVFEPRRTQIDIAIEGMGSSQSAFEQHHALVLAQKLIALAGPYREGSGAICACLLSRCFFAHRTSVSG